MKKHARAQTLDRLKTLGTAIDRAQEHPKDADTIHDLRVAVRRLSQCLKTFKQFVDESAARKMRKRIGKLMDRCAAVRDCDIALALLKETAVDDSKLADALTEKRQKAEAELTASLKRWRHRDVASSWPGRLKTAPRKGTWSVRSTPYDAARAVLPRLAMRLFAAGTKASKKGSSHVSMHQFRIQVKHFRYTLELFQDLYGRELEDRLGDLKMLQDKLGRLNDYVVTQELVKDHPQAAGVMAGMAEHCESEFRTYWSRHFDAAAQKKWKLWLSGTGETEAKKGAHADLHSQARRSRVA